MKSLNLVFVLFLAACLAACADLRGPQPASSPSAAPLAKAADEGARPDEAMLDESSARALPKLALTPEWLYGILASEMAALDGQYASAALTDVDLAKQTRDPRLAQRATQFALASGDLDVTVSSVAMWLELEPGSVLAQENAVAVMLRLGQLKEAEPLIEDLLKRKPDNAGVIFLQLARLLPVAPDKGSAYQFAQKLLKRFDNVPEAHFAVMTTAAQVADRSRVASEFNRLAVMAPQWDLPVAWQVEQLRQRDLNAALSFLQHELARRPQASLELKMMYPSLLVESKRFFEARREFEALLKQYPNNPDLLCASGQTAFLVNDFATARKELQQALDAHYPNPTFIYYSLGQTAEAEKDTKTAQSWYRKIGPSPQYVAAQLRLAYIEAKNGQLKAALARLDRLDVDTEERVAVIQFESELLFEAQQYKEAYALLTRALQRYPRRAELLYQRALVADRQGNLVSAERDLRLLLKQQADNELALNALGYVLTIHTKRYKEAYTLIDKALKIAPDNPMILDSMGWVQYKRGQLHSALDYLKRAYSVLPDPEIAAHYGEVLWKLGREQEALELWRKALEVTPDDEAIAATMKRLVK